MKNEIWKPIFNGRYEISNYGRVISYVRNTKVYLKSATNKKGYKFIILAPTPKSEKTYLIHKLVLTYFKCEKPIDKDCCAHWDGNPGNNHISNLRWVTFKENAADMIRHGRMPRGEKHPHNKLKEKEVLEIRDMVENGIQQSAIARKYNVQRSTIRDICKGKTWKWLTEKNLTKIC